jgi:hypothetical protein
MLRWSQATGAPDAALVVVDADCLPEPEFAMGRVVEHAMLRAKDCFSVTTVHPDVPLVEARCPIAVDGSETNPKVPPRRTYICISAT